MDLITTPLSDVACAVGRKDVLRESADLVAGQLLVVRGVTATPSRSRVRSVGEPDAPRRTFSANAIAWRNEILRFGAVTVKRSVRRGLLRHDRDFGQPTRSGGLTGTAPGSAEAYTMGTYHEPRGRDSATTPRSRRRAPHPLPADEYRPLVVLPLKSLRWRQTFLRSNLIMMAAPVRNRLPAVRPIHFITVILLGVMRGGNAMPPYSPDPHLRGKLRNGMQRGEPVGFTPFPASTQAVCWRTRPKRGASRTQRRRRALLRPARLLGSRRPRATGRRAHSCDWCPRR